MACFLTFDTEEAEHRFKKWVVRGNERSEAMGMASLGLKARVLLVDGRRYLFLWEHLWMFNFALFLRFMLWMQFRKLRKSVHIERVRKLDIVDIVLSRGLKD
jgi:tellurite resistance protein TehA-like permease